MKVSQTLPIVSSQLIKVICTSFLVVLASCTTQFIKPTAATQSTGIIQIQSKSISPKNGGKFVEASDLQTGDILLTATSGVASVGIRAATLAPVSHAALYVGDGQVVEAVVKGVQMRSMVKFLDEESTVVAFRHPKITTENAQNLKAFAMNQIGKSYNHVGIMLHAPFAIERRICELPLIPGVIREACLKGIAQIQLGAMRDNSFFCSQLVVAAYAAAQTPLVATDPRFVSPGDLLHMRENDVPSLTPKERLVYVGHLKTSIPSDSVALSGN
jgi:uncharacterized protein YycO